jgi:hypothetical protein
MILKESEGSGERGRKREEEGGSEGERGGDERDCERKRAREEKYIMGGERMWQRYRKRR